MFSNELYHHGILGMKWGVRRYQNLDGSLTSAGKTRYLHKGDYRYAVKDTKRINKLSKKGIRSAELREEHTVPKGTTIYRVTSNEHEDINGTKYVTYIDADRQLYRSGWIRNQGKTGKAYEHEYTLVEDLKVPSRKEVNEVINSVVEKKKSYQSDTVKAWLDVVMPEGSWRRWLATTDWKDTGKTKEQLWKDYTKEAIKNFGKMTPDEAAFYTSQSFGLNKKVKDEVVNELKKRGYNAMMDEASIGGQNSFPREGIAPMIVFNGETSLVENRSKEISKTDEAKSQREYSRWQNSNYWAKEVRKNPKAAQWSDFTTNEDFLEHWGILGMKWGVRRYQNKDGSLTTAGRSRYGSGKKKVGILEAHRIKKRKAEAVKKRAETLAKKKAEEEDAQKHEAEKQEAIRSGNATQIAKFQNELSNQELRDALDRLNSKQRLSDMVAKEIPKKETKLDKAMKIADKASKYADVAEKGIKAYNTFAKVSNAFADDKNQLPIIGEKRNKDVKDSKKEAAIRSGDPDQIKKWQGKLTPEETKTAMLTADYWKKINSQTTAETIKTGEKAAAEELRKKLSTHSDAYNEAVARVKEWDKRK